MSWVAIATFATLLLAPVVLGVSFRELHGAGVLTHWSALHLFSSVKLAMLAAGRRFRPLDQVLWGFAYVWFVLTPAVQFTVDFFPPFSLFLDPFSARESTAALLLVLLGLLAYEISGRLDARGRRLPQSRSAELRKPFRTVPLVRVVLLLLACGLGVIALDVTSFFLPRRLLTERLQLADSSSGNSLMILTRGSALIASAALASGAVVGRRMNRRLVGALAVLLLAITANPISAPRYWLGTVILTHVLAFAWQRPRVEVWLTRGLVPSLLIAVLVFLPFADQFRTSRAVTLELGTSVENHLATHADYAMFGQVAASVAVVDDQGHDWGRQLSGAALFFVPRSLWTTKPFDTGDHVSDSLGLPTRLNQSSPLWSELHVAGGPVLVILGFALLARITAGVQGRWREASSARAVLFLSISAGLFLFILRGSLLAAAGPAAGTSAMIILLTVPTGAPRGRV